MKRACLVTTLALLLCQIITSCSSNSNTTSDATDNQADSLSDLGPDMHQDTVAYLPDLSDPGSNLPTDLAFFDPGMQDSIETDTAPADTIDAVDTDTVSIDAIDVQESIAAPARYPEGRIHSPITPFVVDHLKAITTSNASLQNNVFMKVGDSITVDQRFLTCLADEVSLPNADLTAAASYFREGNAAGATPFDRDSLAALGGRSASWAISGDPSPIVEEISAISPRFAIIMFGTNDVGWYPDDRPAMLRWYANAMIQLVDGLPPKGIIPILSSIPRRGDNPDRDMWVPTMNAIIRGLAETRQIPFVDFHLALESVTNYGLGSDGVHPNGAPDGACDFSTGGLDYGQNVRNLTTMEILTQLYETVLSDEPPPDQGGRILEGTGIRSDPIRIDALPFSDWRDTSTSTSREFDTYPCGTGQDESGPEFVYRLDLQTSQRLRMMVLDVGSVDIDLYLLDSTSQADGCLARNDTVIQGTIGPGTFYVVIDTYVNNSVEHAGPALLVIHECALEDASCDTSL